MPVSELQKFARCFTKDWRLHSDSFIGIANGYIQQLPPDGKVLFQLPTGKPIDGASYVAIGLEPRRQRGEY